jgi:hypothetical protein
VPFQVEPRGRRKQAAVAQNADGLGVSGAREFRWLAHGPQEFQTPGEAGRFAPRHGGGHGIAGGKLPRQALCFTDGGLVIRETPEPVASAGVMRRWARRALATTASPTRPNRCC